VDVIVPLVDGTSELFRNEDGSGWMKADDCNFWRRLMAGDERDRGKGRRHKPPTTSGRRC